MIRPRSNQKPYDEFWSGDPAFVQAPEDGDTSEIAEAQRAHAAKIKRARQTGNWTDVKVEGCKPTRFVMRPVRGTQLRWLHDVTNSSSASVGWGVLYSLVFRCALVDIVDFGDDFEMTFEDHPHLGRIAHQRVVDALDAIDPNIVSELGALAIERAKNLDPL